MEQLQLINTPTWKELQRWNKQRLEDDEDLETRRKELGLKNNSVIAVVKLHQWILEQDRKFQERLNQMNQRQKNLARATTQQEANFDRCQRAEERLKGETW